MRTCGFSEELLSAYFDGEALAHEDDCEQHVRLCSECRATLEHWRQSRAEILRVVDLGVGDVDPLLALTRVRTRVATTQERSLRVRLAVWWRDLWVFHRRAVAGLVAAAALGALSAPFVVLWAGRHLGTSGGNTATFAGVVIESLEVGGGTQAVVYPNGGGSTTLIWVQPEADESRGH